ncbi:MAG: SIR2 family protein [Flavobacteriales bacterium]|nr:SIR2 family protein [Flavobacteriales bacterium]
MVKNKFNNYVSFLKDVLDKDRLVVFAGSGISKDSGIPLWNELKKGIISYLNEDTSENDPLKIAQLLYNEKGEKEYNEIIKKLLYKDKGKYNPLHEFIFSLNSQHIITTNYDDFFEKVIEDEGLPFSLVSKDEDLPYAEHKRLLIKYHGDFENHNVVLKENDYLNFSNKNTLKEVFVKSLFSNKVILFVGYSVSDPNIKSLIKDIQFILKRHHQKAYWLSHKNEEEINVSEIDYFNDLGINIISSPNDFKIKEVDRLSSIGSKIYNLLNYISEFDNFQYRNVHTEILASGDKKDIIINELYESFKRFHFFKVLPKKLLVSLFPLNRNSPKEEDIYNLHDVVLTIHDEEIFNLIESYQGINDENFSKEQRKKLNFVLIRLIYSGIYFFGQEGGKTDTFGTRRAEKRIDLRDKINLTDNCECLSCTIGRLDYSSAISKISKYSIDHKSDLYDDLKFAYGLYEFKEYSRSYFAFKEIVLKSNRESRYEVGFLAKYNQKLLSYFVFNESFKNKNIEYEDAKKIEKEAEKIDLDAELNKLKFYADKDLFKLLKEIKEGVYIQRICNDIDKSQREVDEIISLIKRGGNRGGSSPFYELESNILKLNNFLGGNFIIDNGFSLINQYKNRSSVSFLNGYDLNLLLNNNIDDERHFFSTPKVEQFDNILISSIFDHTQPKELRQVFDELGLEDIKLCEEDRIVSRINNFLKSSYIEEKYFRGVSVNNNFQSYITTNRMFESEIVRILKNILLIVAYFDFKKETLNILLQRINHFIRYVNIDYRRKEISGFFSLIIYKKYKIIELTILLDSLSVLNERGLYFNDYVAVLEAIKLKNKKFVNKEFDVEAFRFGNNMYKATAIYKTLSAPLKAAFKKRIERELNENKCEQNYYFAINSRILNTKKVRSEYIDIMKKTVLAKPKLENGKQLFNKHNSFWVLQFADTINRNFIKKSELAYLDIKIDYYNFLFNPENFDQNKFNPKWLKELRYFSSIVERLSKIDYVKSKTQKYLEKNYDEELSKFYILLSKC